MGGFLFLIALVGLILWVFLLLIRRRVKSRLEAAGHELPAELKAALQARAAPSRPGAGVAPVAASMPRPTLAPAAAPHFLLIYDLAPDYLQRRAQFRDEHLALAWKAADGGELVLGGALEEPTEQTFLLFKGSRDAALRFAAADPYVKNGLVKAFKVRQWLTVAGASAANPLRPKS
ncbi:MAG: YciI-like protein [Gammaproteobacteria bacterium]